MSRALPALVAALALLIAACEVDEPDDALVEETPVEEPTPEETVAPDAAVEPPGLEADEDATIVELLAAHDDFGELVSWVEAAGLEAELSGDGPFTLFAPADEAFGALPDHVREELEADPDLLAQHVLGHVVDGELTAEELADGDTIEKRDGTERVVLVTDEGTIFVGSALLVEGDVQAANGIVHVVDFVLPSAPADPEESADDEDEEGDED